MIDDINLENFNIACRNRTLTGIELLKIFDTFINLERRKKYI